MIANRALERANIIAKAIRDSGHEIVSPWVLGPIEGSNPNVINVFQRDMKASETADAIVADVSQPSLGVGMGIMAGYKAGKRIILVMKRGNATSRMLEHMDKKEMLEFDDEKEIYSMLRGVLK